MNPDRAPHQSRGRLGDDASLGDGPSVHEPRTRGSRTERPALRQKSVKTPGGPRLMVYTRPGGAAATTRRPRGMAPVQPELALSPGSGTRSSYDGPVAAEHEDWCFCRTIVMLAPGGPHRCRGARPVSRPPASSAPAAAECWVPSDAGPTHRHRCRAAICHRSGDPVRGPAGMDHRRGPRPREPAGRGPAVPGRALTVLRLGTTGAA